MEQEEDYSAVVVILKDLERQFSAVSNGSLQQEYIGAKAAIEDQFQACIDALVARKEILLRETEERYQEQNKVNQELQTTLKSSIEGCKKILDAGALLYSEKKATAISIWKSIDILPSLPHAEPASGIATDFSHMLLDDIKIYGTVYARGGEGSNSSNNSSLSSSSSSLSASSNSLTVIVSNGNEEAICVVCQEGFSTYSNLAGNCAHKGAWHKKDDCKKFKCKASSTTYHWSCCASDKYTLVCSSSGDHRKPKQCTTCGTKYLYSKPGECLHKGAWHTCLAECNSKCIGLAHAGKQHWSCCHGLDRNESKCIKSEHK